MISANLFSRPSSQAPEAFSYENASRGCRDITAVEMNPVHAAFIKSSASRIFGSESYVIHVSITMLLISSRYAKNIRHNICRPPYDLAELSEIPGTYLYHIFNEISPDY
jgi:hypothetical protein